MRVRVRVRDTFRNRARVRVRVRSTCQRSAVREASPVRACRGAKG